MAAWDLIDAAVRAGVSERVLTAAASATPIVIVAPEQYPRLRGASPGRGPLVCRRRGRMIGRETTNDR